MHLQRLTEFSIYLDQRPGELAGILDTFGATGVTVDGFTVSEHQGRGLIRLIGEPVERIRSFSEALTERGLGPVIESEVMAADIDRRPSLLRDLTTALADKGFNVRYAYVLRPASTGGGTRCVLRVDELDRAIETIEGMDWPNGDLDPGSGPATESTPSA